MVSHPDSVSPFPEASFINFSCQLSLSEVTHGNQSFIEFKGLNLLRNDCHRAMTQQIEDLAKRLQMYIRMLLLRLSRQHPTSNYMSHLIVTGEDLRKGHERLQKLSISCACRELLY